MSTTTQNPLLWGRENIFVTREGIAYAMFELEGLPYGYSLPEHKESARAHHQALYQGLLGDYTILGFLADTDPSYVVNAMLDGVDVQQCPAWLNEVNLAMEKFEGSPSGERIYFLIAPLSGWMHPLQRFKEMAFVADQKLKLSMSIPICPPPKDLEEKWRQAARELSFRIPRFFNPKPASTQKVQWIFDHAQKRGLGLDLPYPLSDEVGQQWVNLRSLPEPLLDEGGLSDYEGVLGRIEQFKRRYVKVEHPLYPPSYQCMMVMSSTPMAGFEFPGGEFLEMVNRMPVDCDFAIRITTETKHKAQRDNKKSEQNLNDQYIQQSGGQYQISGGSSDLDQKALELAEYVQALNASDREVQVSASMIFAVGGGDPEEVEEKARYVQEVYASQDFILDAPLGDQWHLWWDMLPGASLSRVANELTQVTTGQYFSYGMPLVSTELGEKTGFYIADNLSSGRRTQVLMNLGGNAEADKSGSFGAVGELGSGKSAFLKTVSSHTIDRGGQMVAVDHSENQEWAALGTSIADATVLDFEDPKYSLDPLRLHGPTQRAYRDVMSLFSMLFTLDSSSQEGGMLAQVMHPENLQAAGITSMRSLRDALHTGRGVPAELQPVAKDVGLLMDTVMLDDYGKYLFDESLPVLSFDSSAIVFCTHGLRLPEDYELSDYHLRRAMLPEKKIGYATYGHIASVAYTICTGDDTRESLFMVDEAAHMTASPEGEGKIIDMIRRGRKHKAATGLGSHVSSDFGSKTLQGLIPHRFVFRSSDTIAGENLEWLAEGYNTYEYRELVKGFSPLGRDNKPVIARAGECLYRDVKSRIGKIQIQLPLDPVRRAATLTTPPKSRAASSVSQAA